MPLIQVHHLSKTYQVAVRRKGTVGAVAGLFSRRRSEIRALDAVSFDIERGELVGYIGPNGAGKSTTVKILSGILVPDSGICEVDGRTPWRERREHVAQIGVVFGQRTQLWWDLPVIESFDLLRDIYRLNAKEYESIRDKLVEQLALSEFLDQPVRQLSLGQRMRADLAASLLHRPRILFLDEPTIGLDAPGKLAVRDFVRTINREDGVTVILTTHDMDDIEALCNRLLVIGNGKIIADGSVEMISASLAHSRRMIVDTDGIANTDGIADTDGIASQSTVGRPMPRLPAGATAEWDAGRLHIQFDPLSTSAPELLAAISDYMVVRDVIIAAPPIEEIVARLYATFDTSGE